MQDEAEQQTQTSNDGGPASTASEEPNLQRRPRITLMHQWEQVKE